MGFHGCFVGAAGRFVGTTVGRFVGTAVGRMFGATDGVTLGLAVGRMFGATDGVTLGLAVGRMFGATDGVTLGFAVGVFVGELVGVALVLVEPTLHRSTALPNIPLFAISIIPYKTGYLFFPCIQLNIYFLLHLCGHKLLNAVRSETVYA